MAAQLITPNPNIPCRPGWCLQYVRETFGIEPGLYPTATTGWNGAKRKYRDRNFPAGVWHPVWFSLRNVPAGHVALRAPWGAVYSTSDDSKVPHLHPDLDDLLNYYNRYGQPITYLGWSADIEGISVISGETINLSSSNPTSEGDLDMTGAQQVTEYVQDIAYDGWTDKDGKPHPGFMLVIEETQRRVDGITKLLLPGEGGERVAGVIPQMIATQQGTLNAILSAITNIGAGEPIDVKAMEEAAERGASKALAELEAVATTTVTLSQEG